jgi:glycoside/pentoside/hexuronide:cation symporter, GPH family
MTSTTADLASTSTSTPTSPGAEALPLGRMLLYGSGQAGVQIMRDTPAVLLPVFMSTMLGISPWLAGLAILVPKLWLMLCDPLVGHWSDRRKADWGRLPFLLVGAPLTALGFALMFWLKPLGSEAATALAMAALYTLMATAYSVYLVPYLALAAELSPDPHRRTTLLAWRIVFTMIGVVAGVGFAQPLIGWAGGGSHGWETMGLVFALISLVAMLCPLPVARGVRTAAGATQAAAAAVPFMQQMRLAWHNRPFRTLLAAYFVQSVGQATSYAAVALVFIFVLGKVDLLIPFILAMSAGSILGQPLWVRLAQRLGKRRVFTLAAAAWAVVTLSWLAAKPGAVLTPLQLPLLGALTTEQGLALLRAPLIGFFNAGFVLMLQSMLTDTVVYDRLRHGRSSEGALSGVFSAAEKLAYAVGPALAGVVLSLSNFHASQGGAVAQDAVAISGVLLNYSLIPAAFVLASLLVIRGYRLTDYSSRAMR